MIYFLISNLHYITLNFEDVGGSSKNINIKNDNLNNNDNNNNNNGVKPPQPPQSATQTTTTQLPDNVFKTMPDEAGKLKP